MLLTLLKQQPDVPVDPPVTTNDCWNGAWGLSWGSSWGSTSVVVEQPKQGGLHGLRAQFKRIETEEQKRLRREAQGIIQRIKQADPVQADELLDDSKEISRHLQGAIAALEALAAEYQAQLEAQQALRAQEEAAALRNLLIEAQLQAELLQQQVEELDVAYIMFMLAAHA